MQTTSTQPGWLDVLKLEARLLTFRATRDELLTLGVRHFLFGLFWTWLVGIGRYWDNSRVGLLQHLGIGSVVYIFVLALFLWLVIWPLRPKDWSYFRVLTFISLVSPPAILYAVPVENMDLDRANTFNFFFLIIVATWRVALLVFFLRRFGQLDSLSVISGTSLPLSIIVVTLTILNLDKVVLDVMGGFHERTPNDSAYSVLLWLSFFSFLLFIPILICYIAMIVANRSQAQIDRAIQEANDNN